MHRLGNQGGEINVEQVTKDPQGRQGQTRIGKITMKLQNLIHIVIGIVCVAATVATAQAEPRQSTERNRNYILRRQQVIPGLGTPTTRLIYGKREIDVYRNGLMFERDHVVGVRAGTR
jgi:hypothetical protein